MEPLKKPETVPEAEERILAFWDTHNVFEKSIRTRKGDKEFVFYDGPPFATGLPHYGHILSSAVKDAMPRYFTMRGYRVTRRWGWDCHGLPIENIVEQEEKVSGKRAIEAFGIKRFNEAARSKVLTYVDEWRSMVRRIGRFVDFDRSYKTMDHTFMESVWWAFKELHKKRLVYRDSRTSLFCPRCETSLSNFEIAMDNSYRDQEDVSVFVKLKVHGTASDYLLVWTTTPWTLPANVAVAVHPKLEYTRFRVGTEYLWSYKVPHDRPDAEAVERKPGRALVGLRYEPLFPLADSVRAYRVYGADFVTTEEGTGLVHVAPAFGEDDFNLGKREKLPLLETLTTEARFGSAYPELKFLEGRSTTEANPIVIQHFRSSGNLFAQLPIRHRYPICWRCSTPLIYKVQPAWFVKVSSLKPKMLALNKRIDWHPEHLKDGRFGKGLETAPDWNLSRSRFWGTPLPIWECEHCHRVAVLGSIRELKDRSVLRNEFLFVRHGEAMHNVDGLAGPHEDTPRYTSRLTERGKAQVERTARGIARNKRALDLIVTSPLARARETAEIVARATGAAMVFDERLVDINPGAFVGRSLLEYNAYFGDQMHKFSHPAPGGESRNDVKRRMVAAFRDIESRHRGKRILIVSHGSPLFMLKGALEGLPDEGIAKLGLPENGKLYQVDARPVPMDDGGHVDLHRPYVDEVRLECRCGGSLTRTPDVFDCWFESGSMPFAELHYPFERRAEFRKRFPADFISEYIAQTRGWFYTLHVVATGLFGRLAFRHAVTTGTIMAASGEKLSKKLKNYPDPTVLFGKYGVDALRFQLLSSPLMAAENIEFSEAQVEEIYKKYVLIATNVLGFFKLYRAELPPKSREQSTHPLDRWITSRLAGVVRDVTKAFEAYELPEATRPLLGFMEDLSTWYVRRSRERIKAGGVDGGRALRTLHDTLLAFAKLAAPVTPFLAERIYQELECKRESVHLEDWPAARLSAINPGLEAAMVQARAVVSSALRAREAARIKIRQPLQKLTVRANAADLDADLLTVIRDEVNVKEVALDPTLAEEVLLDTTITPELYQEGIRRDVSRMVQELRRDAGLQVKDTAAIGIQARGEVLAALQNGTEALARATHASSIVLIPQEQTRNFKFDAEIESKLGEDPIWIGVRKV
jgi:isoleucyl-tRNA synthetase